MVAKLQRVLLFADEATGSKSVRCSVKQPAPYKAQLRPQHEWQAPKLKTDPQENLPTQCPY